MSSINDAVAKRLGFLGTLGKAGLNTLYPKEFEYYMIALELMDANFKTIQYFIFPIMPSSITETIPQLTNTKKTTGGVSVISSSQFVPTNISLSGTFGRSFKVLIGQTYQDLISSFKTATGSVSSQSIKNGTINFFDNRVKTGYGCIKVLQDIVTGSRQIDALGPRYLVLYNLALGNSYFIKPGDLTFTMTMDSNMIWNYSLPVKSIAPLENYINLSKNLKSNQQLVIDDLIQKKANMLVNSLSSALKPITNGITKIL